MPPSRQHKSYIGGFCPAKGTMCVPQYSELKVMWCYFIREEKESFTYMDFRCWWKAITDRLLKQIPHLNFPHFVNDFTSTLKGQTNQIALYWSCYGAYRNILLVFPYGDTRRHCGLPLCWTLPLSIVCRAQPITYNSKDTPP